MAPTNATLIIIAEVFLIMWGNRAYIRRIPYPPNLSRIAARIIDPATGASTCAFGSHKCIENIGSLTINPIMVIIHANDEEVYSYENIIIINIGMEAVFDIKKTFLKATNIGRDAQIV